MLLIPELKIVFVAAPRTASRSIREAFRKRYPKTIQLYSHMEADGVPFGYDRWQKVGFLRHPVERLWSLYNYCKFIDTGLPAWQEKLRQSTYRPFEDWLINNDVVFTDPFDSCLHLEYYPHWAIRHVLPENRKSQFIYLRPDLGTLVYSFEKELDYFAETYDLKLEHLNASKRSIAMEHLSDKGQQYVHNVFSWDLTNYEGLTDNANRRS